MIGGLNLKCLFESAALARDERISNDHKATQHPFPEKVSVIHAKGIKPKSEGRLGFVLGSPYGVFSLGVFTFACASESVDNVIEESVGPIIWLQQGQNSRQLDAVHYSSRSSLYQTLLNQGQGKSQILFKNDSVGLRALDVAKQKYSVTTPQQEPVYASPA